MIELAGTLVSQGFLLFWSAALDDRYHLGGCISCWGLLIAPVYKRNEAEPLCAFVKEASMEKTSLIAVIINEDCALVSVLVLCVKVCEGGTK